jgi:hypothetical protein
VGEDDHIILKNGSKIFFTKGLDGISENPPDGQISWLNQLKYLVFLRAEPGMGRSLSRYIQLKPGVMDSGLAPSGAPRNDERRESPNKNPGIAAGVLHC